jgi:hypothetical protein
MKIACALISCFFLAGCAHQVTYEKEKSITLSQISIEKPLKVLRVGEKFIYEVSWFGIHSGYITLTVKEIVNINATPTYHIVATAQPNSFFRFFYDVEYKVDTYLDVNRLRPLSFHKQRRLNQKVTIEKIEFDYAKNIAHWTYSDPKIKKDLVITKNLQDLLSSLYYFRIQEISLGKKHYLDIFYNGNIWPVTLLAEKYLKINLPGRIKINAIVTKPISSLSTYITGFPKFEAFLTCDKERTPVLFKMPTRIGSLYGVLVNYSECRNSN